MEFQVKKTSKADFYPTFCKWCEQHSFPIISDLVLPENCFVCYKDEIPLYCIWFYHTDSALCYLAFPASHKTVNHKLKIGAFEYLLEQVCKYAKRKKYKVAYTTSGTEKVIENLVKTGFKIGDENVSHYIKTL